MTYWIMRRLKKKHNALWASLVWMEPLGSPTWAVWVHLQGKGDVELARASSRWTALFMALNVPLISLGRMHE